MNYKGEPLYFGKLNYTNRTSSTFRGRVKPRDVKTALVLLNYLFLEHQSVEDSMLFDSAMQLIKASSKGAGVHFNLFGKPNRMFAWFVIDFLSMSILFDTFIEHRSLHAPAPFKKIPLSEKNIAMLVHNKHILIKFCLGQGPSRVVENYFLNEKTGDIGKGCLDLDHLWGTSTKFYRQLLAGIVSSFESYKDSCIGEKKAQKPWIHHFVILQLFHPLFCIYPGEEDGEFPKFKNANWTHFVEKFNNEYLNLYMKMYGDTPNYSWLWICARGKI